MRRILLAAILLTSCRQSSIVVGSKNFTESVLLGEIVAQRLEKAGCDVERKLDLGGTLVCDRASAAGDLDRVHNNHLHDHKLILHRAQRGDTRAELCVDGLA